MANKTLRIVITADGSAAIRGVDKVDITIEKLSRSTRKAKKDANGLRDAYKKLGQITATFGLVSLASDIVATNREFESLRVQLISVTGSSKNAAKAFDDINKFASSTPFQLSELTKAYIQLKNFGINPTNSVMQAITDQTSKLGASSETLSGITLALGQSWAAGKLQGQDILQLITRGVPVWELLAEVTGKNTADLHKMSEQGLLTRDVISKLIQKMGELASGSKARAMDTLNGKISNLSDAWHNFEDALLNDRSEGLIKSFVQSVTNEITTLTNIMGSSLDNQISHAEARIKAFESSNAVTRFLIKGGASGIGFDLEAEKRRLRALKALKEYNSSGPEKAQDTIAPSNPINTKPIVTRPQHRRDVSAKIISDLKREVALYDETSRVARARYEIEKGALKNISKSQKAKILSLSEELDKLDALKKSYDEYDKIIEKGLELARKQREQKRQEAIDERQKIAGVKADLAQSNGNSAVGLYGQKYGNNAFSSGADSFANAAEGAKRHQKDLSDLKKYWEDRKRIISNAANLEGTQKNKLLLNIDKKYHQQRKNLIISATSDSLTNVTNGFSAMAEAAQKYYGKSSKEAKIAFEFYKATAIAKTIIDTYQGAQAAIAASSSIPIVGTAIGIAEAAIIVAGGLAFLSCLCGSEQKSKS